MEIEFFGGQKEELIFFEKKLKFRSVVLEKCVLLHGIFAK